ncbi:MAG: PEP-CTERM sorting domain-containing protein [Okeania sp. SIO2G4]|uniref:PEP-CTERM sorting domain-containing protein n=1 Tax=unclassified Okeania TaxID=2634635 RepID=UPI0013BE6D67|nr:MULTISPECIES: PEP-CTERM sorting domain-containing protein [unclassified Okeania]NEP04363.1 PEP-CTERM sorting domain-containing protein [Okeania sp. SIO4D6]NEP73899.1 PEP-CTERM sorting domain-containing protein [Okeania sp. SIO2G5]NEP94712.1 PEP-CTERM sorting domain-containing protein [Okeania sp. SIO2F5]NEQ92437.1 PEP-CTERM sorting domain-containing protein [Okeania sp. SIO2G4]
MLKKLFVAAAGATISTLSAVSGASAIVNGSFENGFTGWITEDLTTPFFPLIVDGAGETPGFGFFTSDPTDGSLAALHGFDGNGPGIISIAQDVFISSSNTELSFDFRGAWDLVNFVPTSARVFDVNIEEVGGGSTLLSTNFLMANPGEFVSDTGNLTGSLDLSAFANSSVRINFDWFIPEDFTGPAFFQLDNVQLTQGTPDTQGVPEPASILGLLALGTLGATSLKRKQEEEM